MLGRNKIQQGYTILRANFAHSSAVTYMNTAFGSFRAPVVKAFSQIIFEYIYNCNIRYALCETNLLGTVLS